jgi:hypothetical protein
MGNHYISAGPAVSFNRTKEILERSPIWTIVCPDDETIYAWCAPADDWISLYCNRRFDSDEIERVTFCDDDGLPLPDQAKARAECVARPHGADPVKTETMGPFEWLEETLGTQFLDIYGPGPAQTSAWDDSKLTPYAELYTDDTPLAGVHDYVEKTKNMTGAEYEQFAIGEHPGYLERKQRFLDMCEKRGKSKSGEHVPNEEDVLFLDLLNLGTED